MRTPRAVVVGLLALAVSNGQAQQQPAPRWIATWAASAQAAPPRPPADSVDRTPTFVNRTLRQIVRVSLGGEVVRIRVSNEYGDRPLVIGSAHIALRTVVANIDPDTDRPITFSGRSSIVIRAGANMVSDPVSLAIPSLGDVAVTLYLADSARAATRHSLGLQTNYVSAPGDFAGATSFAPDTTNRYWLFLTGVDVVNPAATGVIVTLGNSITDGTASSPDANRRWPNVLAQRLVASNEPPKGVVNEGISGNRVLSPVAGPSALERFDATW